MIRSIRLVNWRSHADSRLEFREGTNLLVGIMGAGKSSVLEAISFALFGTFPALERRKLKLENIVRLNEPEAKAVLEFDWDGSNYRAERSIERDKKGASSKAELYKDGSLLEHGPTAVTKHIEGLTGVDYDLFTRAIYSEQNNIDYFLNLDPRRRKEEIDSLLGLDRFETARANVTSVINRLRARRQGLERQFSPERLASLEKEDADRGKRLEEVRAGLAAASAAYDKSRNDAETLQTAFEEMRRKKEQHESLAKEEIGLAARHASLTEELKDKIVEGSALQETNSGLKLLEAERAGLGAKLKQLNEKLSLLSKESGMIDAKTKAAADAKFGLEKARAEQDRLLAGRTADQLESLLRDAEKALLSLESERKSLERGRTERMESLQKLDPGLSRCPLCLSELSEGGLAHIKQEQEALLAKTRDRLAELPALIAAKNKDAEASKSALKTLSIIAERIRPLEKEAKLDSAHQERKKATEAELAGVEKERRSVQESQELLSVRLESMRVKAAELKALMAKKTEAVRLGAMLDKVKRSISEIGFDAKSYESSRTTAEKARLEAERSLASRTALQKEEQHISEMAAVVRRELSSLRSIQKELALQASMEEQLSLYKNALLETQTGLRLSLADAINTAMNEIWGMFYPYRNYSALRLGVTEKDYLFEVEDGGGWRPLEAIASGGERACAALALRISLAMVLTPKLGWLILDEPTHNLDSEAVELLSSALQTRVPEVVKQTFVITHEERFMGSEFASSYRLKRDKAGNRQTIVEAM